MLINSCNTCCLGIFCSLEIDLLAIQKHFALFSLMYTGNNFDKCGFTGTIFAHQRMNFTALQLKLNIIQCFNTRKNLCNAF